ncbi:MAG: hypothetical protein F4Z08_09890, partial [Chloroflexi bacterium]|nr:hypothetical protein [Chloroflexota bacterium]
MADAFALPDLGEGIEEAEVIGVLVHVGDTVEADQPLIEVETEKANLDVPSPHAGVVEAVLVEVGEVIRVGQPIVSIAATNGASAAPAAPAAEASPPPSDGAGGPPAAPVPSAPAPSQPPPL